MPTKSQIPWLLAAIVLMASSHCVFSHAIEAADWYHELRMEDQPLDNERTTCENESACICKGATFAVVVEAPAPELELMHLVCVEPAAKWLGAAVDSADRRNLPDHGKPPCSGKNLRAQLQRFLL
ncbi:MAG: hypothetical protein ABI614_07780 [Planctomycetota bacterium]